MAHRIAKSAVLVSLIGIGAVSAGACNLVVGAGDFAVGTGVPDAASGDAPAGDDGPAPVVDSGADGDAAVLCGFGIPETPAFKQIVKACVLWAGCTGYFTQISISNCISWNYFASNTNDSALLCMQNVTTCEQVTNCLGLAWATAAQCPTTGTGTAGKCNGSTAINCNGGGGAVTNCVKAAGTTQCGTYALPDDGGTAAGCIVEPTCAAPDGGVEQCDKSINAWYQCVGGVGFGQSCTPAGNECATLAGSTGCYLKGPKACSNPGAVTCRDGETLQVCNEATSTLLTLSCKSAGGTCQTQGSTSDCVSAGCALTQAENCLESCGADHVTAHLCIGGAKLDVNCLDYTEIAAKPGCVMQSNGFATCVP
jgi:hypothetical protein